MEKYTLHNLLSQYSIIIPQIQRDYVQGRNDQLELRENFISKIKESLLDDTSSLNSLNLDFVYGYTKQINEKDTAFIPLDGQQRLTTLWLLYWYLSPKELKSENSLETLPEETKSWLRKFTYETRNSSKRFCEELINNSLPRIDEKRKISELISDASWFMASWKNDPTVIAMLNMLDTIQNQDFDKSISWRNLRDNDKITFDYIDIKSDEFKLTDELYTKMNSRGKPLTAFENFKAKFSEILSSKDTDYLDEKRSYQNTQVSYQQYFAFKIDGVWMDLFWAFSRQNDDEEEIKVDEYFMNFFNYIAQICYFKDNLDKNADDFKNGDFNVFKKKANILFLFDLLDLLHKISVKDNQVDIKKIDDFFSKIFQMGKIDDTYNNIRLFEDPSKGVNLLKKCLIEGSSFDNRHKIILYCVFAFVIKYGLEKPDRLRSFIRIIRNLLQATRQRNETVFRTNVRINAFGKYWKLFEQLMQQEDVYECLIGEVDNEKTDINNDALKNEKQKAEIVLQNDIEINRALFKLEEFEHFSGLIHQLKPQENISKLKRYAQIVREIWNKDNDDSLVISAMIASGFPGFYTKDCRLGEMWFFGAKDKWNTLLTSDTSDTSDNEDISKSIIELLDKYDKKEGTPKKRLSSIVEDYLTNLDKKEWQYYFLKYPQILSKKNYFAWNNYNDFEIRLLGSDGYNPLLAYHINPYVLVVSNLLDNTICEEWCCYTQYSEISGLVLKNGIVLDCKQEGWLIELPENISLDNVLRQKFNISDDLLLIENEGKDRIEIAVDFCKEVFGINS